LYGIVAGFFTSSVFIGSFFGIPGISNGFSSSIRGIGIGIGLLAFIGNLWALRLRLRSGAALIIPEDRGEVRASSRERRLALLQVLGAVLAAAVGSVLTYLVTRP
jgi:hypothetical protein